MCYLRSLKITEIESLHRFILVFPTSTGKIFKALEFSEIFSLSPSGYCRVVDIMCYARCPLLPHIIWVCMHNHQRNIKYTRMQKKHKCALSFCLGRTSCIWQTEKLLESRNEGAVLCLQGVGVESPNNQEKCKNGWCKYAYMCMRVQNQLLWYMIQFMSLLPLLSISLSFFLAPSMRSTSMGKNDDRFCHFREYFSLQIYCIIKICPIVKVFLLWLVLNGQRHISPRSRERAILMHAKDLLTERGDMCAVVMKKPKRNVDWTVCLFARLLLLSLVCHSSLGTPRAQ